MVSLRKASVRRGAAALLASSFVALAGLLGRNAFAGPKPAAMTSGGFMPHGTCYLWNPSLLLLNVTSDALIAIAYFSIPAILLYFIRRRPDIPLRGPIAMFGVFIVACGSTHVLDVWTVWHPAYWLLAGLKTLTAAASIATVAMLVPLIPKILTFRSPAELESLNRRLERRYQRLMDTALEGVITIDRHARVTYVNPKLARTLGYTSVEMLGRAATEFVAAADLSATATMRNDEGAPLPVEAQSEGSFAHKDGSELWLLCSATPLYDENGRWSGAQGMFVDMTARRSAELALLRSERQYRLLAEALPQIVWTSTPDGKLDYCNKLWFDYTGTTFEQTQGWGWGPVLHPDDLQRCIDVWTNAVASGTPYEIEYRFKRASDQTYRWHLGRALPVRDAEGAIVKWLGSCTDIDDQKRALEAQVRLSEQLQVVVEATDRLSNAFDIDEASVALCDAVVPRFADWATVDLIEPDGRTRNAALRHADPGKADAVAALAGSYYVNPNAVSPVTAVIESGRPLVQTETPHDERSNVFVPGTAEAVKELGFGSVICVPLNVRGKIAGVLTARWSSSDRCYNDADLPFFGQLANRAAVAFDETVRHDRARASEEIMRRIMQNSEDCIAILTLDGRIVNVNEQGRKRFSAAGHALGRDTDWIECWHPGERGAARTALAAAAAGSAGTYRGTLAAPGGARQWWDVVVTPIDGAPGVPAQLLVISRDITRQRHDELALQANERRYRALANAMPQLAFTALGNGTIDFVNDCWKEYTGLSLDESVEQGALSVTHPDDREAVDAAWVAAMKTGRTYEIERRLQRRSDGEYRWHLMRAVPARDVDGTILHWFGTGTDIHDKKQAEIEIAKARDEALRAATIKARFVATMSHEIRTPMSGVIGMTELLLLTSLSSEQREYAKVVRDSGQSLLRIINDVLDSSKMDAGKLELESVEFELARQVASIVDLFRHQCEQKKLALSARIEPDVPRVLVGDPGRLRQILVNLVGNAVKFTPAGGSVNVLAVKESAQDGTMKVRFTVEDTCIGMSPEVQRCVFEPFAQGDGSVTRGFGGTGLGLSISKHLVELMGGSIGFASDEGRGATFWFDIPFSVGTRKPRADDVPARELGERRWTKQRRDCRVLLVDDNALITLLATRQFKELGIELETAPGGLRAVEAAHAEPYDLIFMDCHMPEMDGFAATREIRRLEAGTARHVPIIAMTADAQEKVRQACLAAGMDDYLSKPSNLAGLEAMLQRWLVEPQAPAAPVQGTP